LDIGCGPNPKPGFEGVDRLAFDGKVQHVHDVRITPWPFPDASVGEVHCSHFLEHLTGVERVSFMNELWRVLADGGSAQIIVPYWASNRAYGDPTHQWPPVSEMWFCYLSAPWRAGNAPHTDGAHWEQGFRCHFDWSYGYALSEALASKNDEYRQFAMQHYKEAASDLIATVTKRPLPTP
jgi:hypothetical protein